MLFNDLIKNVVLVGFICLVQICCKSNSSTNLTKDYKCEAFKEPPFHGTIFIDSEIVTPEDSSTFVRLSYNGRQERVMFEKWQYAAFNQQTFNMGYYNDYVGQVDIYLLNRQMQRTYGLKLHEAFPSTLGDVTLSYDSTGIINWGISMNFRYCESLDINQKPPSLADRIGQTITNTVERNISRALPAVLNRL